MIFDFKVKGDWNKTLSWLEKLESFDFDSSLNAIGKQGVAALEKATPKDSGLAAGSWGYTLVKSDAPGIEWHNYDIEGGCNVAILIEYGHGLHQGGYISPNPFIDDALKPIFESVVEELWREVNKL